VTTLAADAGYRVTLVRVLRSEWTKLRSLRSTWWVMGAMVVLSVGLAGVFGWGYQQQLDDGTVTAGTGPAIEAAYSGLQLFGLVIGALGVLQMAGEYGTGSIHSTLVAVPRRLPVLWTKALALIGLTLPVMIAVSFLSFLISGIFATGDNTGLDDPGVLRAIFGAAAFPVLLGLLGLGFGTLVRNTAAAITLFVAILLILPPLLFPLPESARDAIQPYQPLLAGEAMFAIDRVGGPSELLSPLAGTLVLVGWVVALLAGGALALRRRDA
jgi:ABC-2 type transport system permease protein